MSQPEPNQEETEEAGKTGPGSKPFGQDGQTPLVGREKRPLRGFVTELLQEDRVDTGAFGSCSGYHAPIRFCRFLQRL